MLVAHRTLDANATMPIRGLLGHVYARMRKIDSWYVFAIHTRPHPTAAEQMQISVHRQQHTARVGAADDTVRGLCRYADRIIKTGVGAGYRVWKHDIGKVLR